MKLTPRFFGVPMKNNKEKELCFCDYSIQKFQKRVEKVFGDHVKIARIADKRENDVLNPTGKIERIGILSPTELERYMILIWDERLCFKNSQKSQTRTRTGHLILTLEELMKLFPDHRQEILIEFI